MSSSRSSEALIGEPSSWRASRSIEGLVGILVAGLTPLVDLGGEELIDLISASTKPLNGPYFVEELLGALDRRRLLSGGRR